MKVSSLTLLVEEEEDDEVEGLEVAPVAGVEPEDCIPGAMNLILLKR
jgi:hypothetical protein